MRIVGIVLPFAAATLLVYFLCQLPDNPGNFGTMAISIGTPFYATVFLLLAARPFRAPPRGLLEVKILAAMALCTILMCAAWTADIAIMNYAIGRPSTRHPLLWAPILVVLIALHALPIFFFFAALRRLLRRDNSQSAPKIFVAIIATVGQIILVPGSGVLAITACEALGLHIPG
jgi:cytochrome c biogenesis factor